jgi:uncharacterized protein YjiS (DUF1127 family)
MEYRQMGHERAYTRRQLRELDDHTLGDIGLTPR